MTGSWNGNAIKELLAVWAEEEISLQISDADTINIVETWLKVINKLKCLNVMFKM